MSLHHFDSHLIPVEWNQCLFEDIAIIIDGVTYEEQDDAWTLPIVLDQNFFGDSYTVDHVVITFLLPNDGMEGLHTVECIDKHVRFNDIIVW